MFTSIENMFNEYKKIKSFLYEYYWIPLKLNFYSKKTLLLQMNNIYQWIDNQALFIFNYNIHSISVTKMLCTFRIKNDDDSLRMLWIYISFHVLVHVFNFVAPMQKVVTKISCTLCSWTDTYWHIKRRRRWTIHSSWFRFYSRFTLICYSDIYIRSALFSTTQLVMYNFSPIACFIFFTLVLLFSAVVTVKYSSNQLLLHNYHKTNLNITVESGTQMTYFDGANDVILNSLQVC